MKNYFLATCPMKDYFGKAISYEKLFKEYHLKAERGPQSKTDNVIIGHWIVQGKIENHEKVIQALLLDQEIKEFDF